MVEFGPNGTVTSGAQSQPSGYTVDTETKIKRIGLASVLCGIGACFMVALIGVICLFLGFQSAELFGQDADMVISGHSFLEGIGIAVLMSAMNWYFGYISIPITAIVLGFSLGRFPRRGIVHAGPYHRWGAIWGALLVGGTTGIASYIIPNENQIIVASGALLMGLCIGAVAGFVCGGTFRAIVRPAEQMRQIQVDVF